MGLLDFLGPLKPVALVVVWVTLGTSWFLAIVVGILGFPFSLLISGPWIIILIALTILAFMLQIKGSKDPENCRLVDGNLVCDI